MKEANHLSILTVTRGGGEVRIPNEGGDRRIWGGGLRFSDSLIFGGGKLNQVFFYVTVVSFKYGFFLFVFVCLFVSLRVCVGKYYLALIEALGIFLPSSITDPGHFKSKRRHPSRVPDSISTRRRKKHCFCNCMKERNIFFFGRYVIEGDWKNKGLPTTGATHLTTKHCWVETPKISHGNNESF